jgi:hypothetical protein
MKRSHSSPTEGEGKHPAWKFTKLNPDNETEKICTKCSHVFSVCRRSEKIVSHLKGTCEFFQAEENKEAREDMLAEFAAYAGPNSKKQKLERPNFKTPAGASVLDSKNVNPLNSVLSLAASSVASSSVSVSSTPNSKSGGTTTNVDSSLR